VTVLTSGFIFILNYLDQERGCAFGLARGAWRFA
jgi:hypothetical protein